jgi:hypothetical protein
MKSFQGLSLVLMAASWLFALSFEATAVHAGPYSKTHHLRNLAQAKKDNNNNDDDISPTKVVKPAASPGGLSDAADELALTNAKDDDSVSNAASVKKISVAGGSSNRTNTTKHEKYYPQAWNSTGKENNETSDMTTFVDDDGIHGFADKVTYVDPVTTLNGEPLLNNSDSNNATLVPMETDQPSSWPMTVVIIFLVATVGLCVSTVYKNRKRSGYEAVPHTTSLVV